MENFIKNNNIEDNNIKYNSLKELPRNSFGGIDWYKVLEESKVKNLLKHYNDILVENRKPFDVEEDENILGGWHLALRNIEIYPNKYIDIYHIDTRKNKGHFNRIFIHEK